MKWVWPSLGVAFFLLCFIGYLGDWGGHGDDFWGGLPVPESMELRVSKPVGAIILAPIAWQGQGEGQGGRSASNCAPPGTVMGCGHVRPAQHR